VGFVPRTLMLSVHAGESVPQRVELEPLPPPARPESTPRPRPEQTELLAPSDRPKEAASPNPLENAEPGYLVADTTPWARVVVDGEDTGKMTPIAERSGIPVAAGKHVVTFVVGEQRFSYTIMVEPGQPYVLKKELPVSQ
jgi:hypothetical protein